MSFVVSVLINLIYYDNNLAFGFKLILRIWKGAKSLLFYMVQVLKHLIQDKCFTVKKNLQNGF